MKAESSMAPDPIGKDRLLSLLRKMLLIRRSEEQLAKSHQRGLIHGACHEGLNLASIWKLPVLFVCENNEFATEIPFRYAAGNPTVAGRAASYGMTGLDLDGNDVLAIHAAAEQAVQRARQGDGPTLL